MSTKKPVKSKLQIDPTTGLAYYNMNTLMNLDAVYSIVYSGRSDGKTSEGLEYAITKFVESGYKNQTAYLRRWDEDIKGSKGKTLFNGLLERDRITEITNGEYSNVIFKNRAFYLANYDEELDKMIPMEYPVVYTFALSMWGHHKGTSYPNITTIIFDEFIPDVGQSTLVNEYMGFMNFISSIARKRGDVKVIMMANTVNRSSLYFKEMGLTKIVRNQEQATIEQVKTAKGTTIALEYGPDTNKASKVKTPSDILFGFDNQKLDMITSGAWSLGDYKHLPGQYAYKNEHIRYFYNVIWDYDVLRCNVVKINGCVFTHVIWEDRYNYNDIYQMDEDSGHMMIVSPYGKKHRVYSPDNNPEPNWHTRILSPRDKVGKFLASFFATEDVFYEDNEVGSIMQNYLNWC